MSVTRCFPGIGGQSGSCLHLATVQPPDGAEVVAGLAEVVVAGAAEVTGLLVVDGWATALLLGLGLVLPPQVKTSGPGTM